MNERSAQPQCADFGRGQVLEGEALVAAIAARAMTLEEILAGHTRGEPKNRFDSAALLERWSRLVAGGDPAALRRRLAWDGLDEETVASALNRPPEASIPPYLHLLPEVLTHRPSPPPWDQHDELPFSHLLAPWVASARRRLAAHAPAAAAVLAETAQRDAERHLLDQLSALAATALYQEFERWRAAEDTLALSRRDPNRDVAYRRFVEQISGPQFATWLLHYSVLTRHLCLLTFQWSEAMAELAARLDADLAALADAFAAGHPLGAVQVLQLGLSDRHAGGRQVAILQFESGVKLVYKPRDVTLEAAWDGFIAWLRAEGLACTPPGPRVLARTGYGWVEHVEHEEVIDPESFSRRAGALVALAWLLGGVDLHEDNLIATAAGPALVDAEALLQPARSDLSSVATSLLGTGLLTFPIVSATGELVDAGGLVGGERPPPPHRQWEHIGRDAMRPVLRPFPPRPPANLPHTGGRAWRVTERIDDLEAGFAATYRFCLHHRERLLDPHGPLRPFAAGQPRLVFRPTDSYVRLQRALLAPAYQRLGVDRSIALDAINRVFVEAHQRPRLWPLTLEERTALEQLDIPRFTLPATAATLTTAEGQELPEVIVRSGWGSLQARIRGLSEEELARLRHLLRRCAATQPIADECASAGPAERAAARFAWRQELLAAAEECAVLIERALFAGRSVPNLTLWSHASVRDLAHGLPGIALFFAALSRLTGETRWRSRAAACWRAVLAEPPEGAAPMGAAEGLGGRLYALALIAALLEDNGTAAAAEHHLQALARAANADGEGADVYSGRAGAILGLLAVHQVFAAPRALEVAQGFARKLLQAQRVEGGWSPPESAAPGFAHGAAGIACALARAAAQTADVQLHDAAHRAFRCEASLFDPRRRRWPTPARSVSGGTRHISMNAWCNGAPGVAMAIATAMGGQAYHRELEEALAATRRAGVSGLDHLCCGSFGIIDVLLTCGQVAEQEDLIRAATARAVVIVRRAESGDGFAVIGEGEGSEVRLGLLHGFAGVGYQALRLAAPEVLPSLLAFSSPGGATS